MMITLTAFLILYKVLLGLAENTHLGCYSYTGQVANIAWTDYTNELPEVTVETCSSKCMETQHHLAGLMKGNQCWCTKGQLYGIPVCSTCCGLQCETKYFQKCGGMSALDVYETEVDRRFIGCFQDVSPRAFPNWHSQNDDRLTSDTCIQSCAKKNYLYAATQNGESCFCGNDNYTRTGRCVKESSLQCDKVCLGNARTLCGGSWANSIYKIKGCKDADKWGPNCDKSCHCKHDASCDYITGRCPNDECGPNWAGPACSNALKDPLVYKIQSNRKCGINPIKGINSYPTTKKLMDANYSTCELFNNIPTSPEHTQISIVLYEAIRIPFVTVITNLTCSPKDGLEVQVSGVCEKSSENCLGFVCIPQVENEMTFPLRDGLHSCTFLCPGRPVVSHLIVNVYENAKVCDIILA